MNRSVRDEVMMRDAHAQRRLRQNEARNARMGVSEMEFDDLEQQRQARADNLSQLLDGISELRQPLFDRDELVDSTDAEIVNNLLNELENGRGGEPQIANEPQNVNETRVEDMAEDVPVQQVVAQHNDTAEFLRQDDFENAGFLHNPFEGVENDRQDPPFVGGHDNDLMRRIYNENHGLNQFQLMDAFINELTRREGVQDLGVARLGHLSYEQRAQQAIENTGLVGVNRQRFLGAPGIIPPNMGPGHNPQVLEPVVGGVRRYVSLTDALYKRAEQTKKRITRMDDKIPNWTTLKDEWNQLVRNGSAPTLLNTFLDGLISRFFETEPLTSKSKNVLNDMIGPSNSNATRILGGLGNAVVPLYKAKSPVTKVGQIMQTIKNTVQDSEGNPTYWNGKTESVKAIWDSWINQFSRTNKYLSKSISENFGASGYSPYEQNRAGGDDVNAWCGLHPLEFQTPVPLSSFFVPPSISVSLKFTQVPDLTEQPIDLYCAMYIPLILFDTNIVNHTVFSRWADSIKDSKVLISLPNPLVLARDENNYPGNHGFIPPAGAMNWDHFITNWGFNLQHWEQLTQFAGEEVMTIIKIKVAFYFVVARMFRLIFDRTGLLGISLSSGNGIRGLTLVQYNGLEATIQELEMRDVMNTPVIPILADPVVGIMPALVDPDATYNTRQFYNDPRSKNFSRIFKFCKSVLTKSLSLWRQGYTFNIPRQNNYDVWTRGERLTRVSKRQFFLPMCTRLRRFNKGSKFLKFKILPRFQFYDTILKCFPKIKRKWEGFNPDGNPENVVQGEQLMFDFLTRYDFNRIPLKPTFNTQYDIWSTRGLYFPRMGGFYLVGNQDYFTSDDFGMEVKFRTFRPIPNAGDNAVIYSQNTVGLYLFLNHTLASWFYGKKSSLQKVSQNRIDKWLRADTQDFKNVKNFFGVN